jgi:hypothetical protein
MIDDDDGRITTSDPAPPLTAKANKKSSKQTPQAPADHVWIGSVGVWVPQAWSSMYPLVGQLVTEDLSWRVGVLLWQSRRPSRRLLAAHARWCREGAALEEKRERLRETARELGLHPQPIVRASRWSIGRFFCLGR